MTYTLGNFKKFNLYLYLHNIFGKITCVNLYMLYKREVKLYWTFKKKKFRKQIIILMRIQGKCKEINFMLSTHFLFV